MFFEGFVGAVIVALIGFSLFLHFVPIPLYISAVTSGVRVGFVDIIMMRLQGIDPHMIVRLLIIAAYSKIDPGGVITSAGLQKHYRATRDEGKGDVNQVVAALVAAHKANISLTFEEACRIDLAGRDVLDAVRMSVNPKVIKTPLIEAVAQDGIQVKAVCQITVRADINRLIGSASEDTVLARVGEGIVTAIGKSRDFREVLENPDLITEQVQATGVDSGTYFEVLSIDIADVDVGENIGARLQIDQAEADKQVAHARAEQRRSAAQAYQAEMRAEVEKMKAKVVASEAMVPQAMSDALSSSHLTPADYYKLKNLLADTTMRESLAGSRKG